MKLLGLCLIRYKHLLKSQLCCLSYVIQLFSINSVFENFTPNSSTFSLFFEGDWDKE